MTILNRFKTIMTSNINALLDKAEDPEKMVDQILRDLDKDLRNVKAETATIMADEKRAKRELDECLEEIDKMEGYAIKALKQDNEEDARRFLTEKKSLEEREGALKTSYELAVENSLKMKEMHGKLVKDIGELESRKASIKAKMAVAKTQEKINEVGKSAQGVGSSLDAFARMEEKANRSLDEAEAMRELNKSMDSDIEDLTSKYDIEETSDLDDELARLKNKLKEEE